ARANARFEAMVDEPSLSFWPTPTISLSPIGISVGSKPDYGPETLPTWPSPTIMCPGGLQPC
ncbi:MAG: hypothetical protein WA709_11235, partial [Stellaceae bacterium]